MRLRAMIDAVEADTDLGPLGRLAIHQRTLRLLTGRLLLEDLVTPPARDPRHRTRRPDHRDRTAALGHDAPRQPHRGRHAAAIAAVLGKPRTVSRAPARDRDRDGIDPRFVRCERDYDAQMQMVPLLNAMHHQYPTAIEEEIELEDLDFASYTLEWLARVPAWRDFYFTLDQRTHYAYMKKGIASDHISARAEPLGAEVAAALGTDSRPPRDVSRRDVRDHAPRSCCGDPIGRDDARVRRSHAPHDRRRRRTGRVLGRARRPAAPGVRARPRPSSGRSQHRRDLR